MDKKWLSRISSRDFARPLIDLTIHDLGIERPAGLIAGGNSKTSSSGRDGAGGLEVFLLLGRFDVRPGHLNGTTTTRLCLMYPQKGGHDQGIEWIDRCCLLMKKTGG